MHNFCNLTVPSACKRVFLAVLCKKETQKSHRLCISASTMASCWSGRRGSNSLPPPWQGGALPDELRPHIRRIYPCTLPNDPCEFRGPRKDLRSKGLWGEGENLVFITEVLLARLPDEYQDFRRGASDRNRTNDTGIFSPLLYRLSYRGITGAFVPAPSHSYSKRGPRKCLRSKDLWGRGGISAFAAAVLRAGLPGKPLTFRRSDPDRARTDDPQRDRLVL